MENVKLVTFALRNTDGEYVSFWAPIGHYVRLIHLMYFVKCEALSFGSNIETSYLV